MAKSLFQESVKLVGLPGVTAGTRYVGATTSGYPTSGSFLVGDFSVDQTGGMWVCTASGSPGTWVRSGVPINENIAGKNFIINGGMDIWQRGTSTTSINAGPTAADRWALSATTGNLTFSQNTTFVPPGARYSYTASGTSGGGAPYFYQVIETANSIPLAGQTITVSAFIARSDSGNAGFSLDYSTTVDNAWSGTYTNIGSSLVTTTTTFPSTPQSATFTIPSTAKTVRLTIYATNNLLTGGTYTLGNVQLEIGSIATAFSRAGGTIGGELALCQRYYWQSAGGANTALSTGFAMSTTSFNFNVPLPVPMRIGPSSFGTTSGSNYFYIYTGGSFINFNSVTGSTVASTPTMISMYITTAGLTTGYGGLVNSNNTNGYVYANAEL